MDSSISQDPFAPEGSGEQEDLTVFNEARWKTAGASEADLERLYEEFDAMTPEEQEAENLRIRGVSNTALAAELSGESAEETDSDPADPGNDPADATTDQEQAAGGEQQVPEAQPGQETTVEVPTGSVAKIEEWVGDDAGRARVALDAEQASRRPRTSLIEKLEKVAGSTS